MPGIRKRVMENIVRTSWVRPGYIDSWILSGRPEGKILERYELDGARVEIYENGSHGYVYFLIPEEYYLSDDDLSLVRDMIARIQRHVPEDMMGSSIKATRRYVENWVRENLLAMVETYDDTRIKKLSRIVARYTVGFGIIEHLIADGRISDIYVDSPPEKNRIHVALADGRECITNIIYGQEPMQGLVSKLRLYSGKRLGPSEPVLEYDLDEYNARFTLLSPPLSTGGPALSIRRHSTVPWTLTRLIVQGSLDSRAAALLSLYVDGASAMIIAGSRGSGKTSLLSALLYEIPVVRRVITIEDTPELPVNKLQSAGYSVQPLFVSMSDEARSPARALRTSLRLGDSAIVIGEIRGEEAKVLYEAMRIGTASNTVIGTFHAKSPMAVYDRMTQDLGISHESFLATDVIVMTAGIRYRGGMTRRKAITTITEVHNGDDLFVDIMALRDGKLTPQNLGSSLRLREIAEDWGISMTELTENLKLRAKIKSYLVREYRRTRDEYYIMPDATIRANTILWNLRNRFDATAGFEEWEAEFLDEWEMV